MMSFFDTPLKRLYSFSISNFPVKLKHHTASGNSDGAPKLSNNLSVIFFYFTIFLLLLIVLSRNVLLFQNK